MFSPAVPQTLIAPTWTNPSAISRGASQNADHGGSAGPHVPLIIFSRHERPAIGRI